MWQVGGGVSIDISRWQTNPRSSRIYDPLWLYRRLCQGNPRTAIEKRLKEAAPPTTATTTVARATTTTTKATLLNCHSSKKRGRESKRERKELKRMLLPKVESLFSVLLPFRFPIPIPRRNRLYFVPTVLAQSAPRVPTSFSTHFIQSGSAI